MSKFKQFQISLPEVQQVANTKNYEQSGIYLRTCLINLFSYIAIIQPIKKNNTPSTALHLNNLINTLNTSNPAFKIELIIDKELSTSTDIKQVILNVVKNYYYVLYLTFKGIFDANLIAQSVTKWLVAISDNYGKIILYNVYQFNKNLIDADKNQYNSLNQNEKNNFNNLNNFQNFIAGHVKNASSSLGSPFNITKNISTYSPVNQSSLKQSMSNINQMIVSPSIPAKIQKPLAAPSQYAQPLPAAPQYAQPLAAPLQYAQPLPAAPQYAQPLAAPSQYSQPLPAAPQYAQPLPAAPQYAQPLPAPSTTNIYGIAKYMGLSPQKASNQIEQNCQIELAKTYVPIKGPWGFGDSPQYADCKAKKKYRLAEAKAKLANPGIPRTINLSRPIPVTSAPLYQGAIGAGGSRKKNNKSKK